MKFIICWYLQIGLWYALIKVYSPGFAPAVTTAFEAWRKSEHYSSDAPMANALYQKVLVTWVLLWPMRMFE